MEISIIITAYNKGPYIKGCLLGVLNQDYQGDFEVILADDCSTDNTFEEINSLQEQLNFAKVRYTKHLKNKGLMGNFIWALNQAKGKYIALCDGDDVWTSVNKLTRQIEVLGSNKSLIGIGTHEIIIDSRNDINKIKYSDLYLEYKNSQIIKKEDFLHNHKLPFHTSTLMFRNESIIKNKLQKFSYVKMGNDIALYHVLNTLGNVYFLNETHVTRSHNIHGITYNVDLIELDLIINKYFLLINCAKIYNLSKYQILLRKNAYKYKRKAIIKYSNRSLRYINDAFFFYFIHRQFSIVNFYLNVLFKKISLYLAYN